MHIDPNDCFLELLLREFVVIFSYLQSTIFGDIMVSTSGIHGPTMSLITAP